MNLTPHSERATLRIVLNEIILAHGLWPVLKTLATMHLRKPPAANADPPLNNHLRRDIGLPPLSGRDRHLPPRW